MVVAVGRPAPAEVADPVVIGATGLGRDVGLADVAPQQVDGGEEQRLVDALLVEHRQARARIVAARQAVGPRELAARREAAGDARLGARRDARGAHVSREGASASRQLASCAHHRPGRST